MSKRLERHLHLLRVLARGDKKLRDSLIRNSDESLVHCLCECALNTLKGNVPLTTSQKKKLAVHKKSIRELAVKHPSLKHKKKLLVQRGGAFLPLLLAPIIGALINRILPS